MDVAINEVVTVDAASFRGWYVGRTGQYPDVEDGEEFVVTHVVPGDYVALRRDHTHYPCVPLDFIRRTVNA